MRDREKRLQYATNKETEARQCGIDTRNKTMKRSGERAMSRAVTRTALNTLSLSLPTNKFNGGQLPDWFRPALSGIVAQ